MWYHVCDYYFKNDFGYSGDETFCRKLALYTIREFYPSDSYNLRVMKEKGGVVVEICKKSFLSRVICKLRHLFHKGGAR